MHLFDRVTVDGTRRTGDGYLTVNARVARAGNVQEYLGSEVGRPNMSVVRIFRPEEEVFSKDTLASFAHRPITLGHPSAAVTADTWASVAKGWSDGEVARDGEFIRISMLLADAQAIRAVETGTRQISMGYDCELDWTPGTTPRGETYDAKQVRIRGNHVAIVEAARGGPELRIGDSKMTGISMTDSQATAVVDHQMRTQGFVDQSVIDAEAAKPEYDWCRDRHHANGTPLSKHYALMNLLHRSTDGQRSTAAYDAMVHRTGDAHRAPDNDNKRAKEFARDGRPMSALSPQERAYEGYVDSLNAWRD